MQPLDELVRAMYKALAAGDAKTIAGLLDPGFESNFAAGLPDGIGGRHIGPEASMREAWWPLGRLTKTRAEPLEWIPTADGRLLVRGIYRGRARASDAAFEAEFMHLWSGAAGRLTGLRQLTDTVQWLRALEAPATSG